MDLGSALLSAEMALEFLSDEQRPQVHLCPAPLVEGALAAAVQASVGASAAQVMAEALGALAVKVEHMGGAAAEPVSYTHLDVYKRQFYDRALSGAEVLAHYGAMS